MAEQHLATIELLSNYLQHNKRRATKILFDQEGDTNYYTVTSLRYGQCLTLRMRIENVEGNANVVIFLEALNSTFDTRRCEIGQKIRDVGFIILEEIDFDAVKIFARVIDLLPAPDDVAAPGAGL